MSRPVKPHHPAPPVIGSEEVDDEIPDPDPNAPPESEEDRAAGTVSPYFDESNPRSLINLLPPKVKYFVKKIPPELIKMTPGRLRARIGQRYPGNDTKQTLELLRIGFWEEYDRVQREKEGKMNLSKIYNGIVNPGYFIETICEQPAKLAYVLSPITEYLTRLNGVLDKATALLESALELSPILRLCRCHYGCICKRRQMQNLAPGQKKPLRGPIWSEKTCACDPTCICPARIDSKHLSIIMEIHKSAEMRLKGSIIQKVSQTTLNKSLNVNIEATANLTPGQLLPDPKKGMTMDEIEARLEELKKPKATPLALPNANALNAMPVVFSGVNENLLEPEVLDAEIVE